MVEQNDFKCCKKNKWGGKREQAGRKKTCLKKVPFNRRINENILKILREYSERNGITETEALESAILLQNNVDKIRKGEKMMKIVIPTKDGKLCGHFGNCESFTFADVDMEKKEILNIESKVPEEGISCQSASWIAEQGTNIILAGGMGMRPMTIFFQCGVQVVAGCPELPIREVLEQFMARTLESGENTCSGEHHEGHHCHHHQH